MKKTLIYIFMVVLALSLCGCSRNIDKRNTLIDAPIEVNLKKSDNIDVDVYLDGTFSMAGYVNFSNSTNYTNALKNIEKTIAGNWKKENIQYVKFGDKFQSLNRNEFLDFDKVEFYQEKDTSLQNVIDEMNSENLNILVTDLFQTNQDTNSLLMALKKNCFTDDNKAIAIIGIKSQFNGKVYDVGKTLKSFFYKSSEDDIATYRPFYLLVIGKEVDVKEFVKNYKNEFDKNIIKTIVFSKNMSNDVHLTSGKRLTFSKDKSEKIANMASISSLLGNNSDVLQYRLNLDEKKSGFKATLNVNDFYGIMPKEFDKFPYRVERWEKISNKNDDKQSIVNGFKEIDTSSFLKIDVIPSDNKNSEHSVDLLFCFNPRGIDKNPGKYRLNISMMPSKEFYLENGCEFSEWNFDEDKVGDEELKLNGGKTLNISNFIRMVSTLNYEMNKPGFYNIYIYIEAVK